MNQSLYLFRHAESMMNVQPHLIGGRSNEALLTKEGVSQAKRLGKYLLSTRITPDTVYASPALRTIETARIVLAEMGITTQINKDDRLQELDQGSSVGRDRTGVYTPSVLSQIDREGKDFALPGGESMNEVGKRMKEWADSIPEMDNTTFTFTHGVAIRCLVSALEQWTHKRTYESETLNVSVTRLKRIDGTWLLDYLGRQSQS